MKANASHQIPSDHAPNIPKISKQYLIKKLKMLILKKTATILRILFLFRYSEVKAASPLLLLDAEIIGKRPKATILTPNVVF